MPRRQSLCLDAGTLDRSLRDRRHPTAGQGLMERRHHAQEHLLGIHDWAGMEEVILDRGADILRQRQDRGAARLAAETKDARPVLTETSFGLAAEELDDGDREWFEDNVLQVREWTRMMDLARPLGAHEEGTMAMASWVQHVLDAVGD